MKRSENAKRILLNDPDVIIQRLDNVDKEIARLQMELTNTQTELNKSQTELTKTQTAQTKTHTELSKTQTELSKTQTELNKTQTELTKTQLELTKTQTELTHTKTDLADEKAKHVNLREVIQNMTSPGSTYVRWGRKTCTGSDLVYTGFAAGQSYIESGFSTRYGGPANTLCLPNDPELSNKTAGMYSFLYGTEYQENIFTNGAYDEDVPCALCRSPNTYATIMIPGRKTCYSGWKMEYNGLLASNSFAHKASSFKCIDIAPEFLQGGKEDKNGNLLYTTGTKCGSLPCPPYTENMVVNCVVCSK